MADLPKWAQRIVHDEARRARRARPTLTWQTTRKSHRTAGSCREDHIFIRAGRSVVQAKITLLHELAHWLTAYGHTQTFWYKAWELYRRHHVPIGLTLRDESYYRQGALWAYWASRDKRGRRPAGSVVIKTRVSSAFDGSVVPVGLKRPGR